MLEGGAISLELSPARRPAVCAIVHQAVTFIHSFIQTTQRTQGFALEKVRKQN